MNRTGPRTVALTAAAFYGLGVFLASFSANKLWWLYLSYGFIGGIGLGLGYIVPVAVLVKWFPDRRGLITGVAVGGFGAGALVTAARCHAADRKRGRPADVRLSRRRVSGRHSPRRFVHEKPASGMAARRLDTFGVAGLAPLGPIYGLMLTAWGIASAIGPLLIARLRETTGTYRGPLRVIAAVMIVSALPPLVVSPPRPAVSRQP